MKWNLEGLKGSFGIFGEYLKIENMIISIVFIFNFNILNIFYFDNDNFDNDLIMILF